MIAGAPQMYWSSRFSFAVVRDGVLVYLREGGDDVTESEIVSVHRKKNQLRIERRKVLEDGAERAYVFYLNGIGMPTWDDRSQHWVFGSGRNEIVYDDDKVLLQVRVEAA